MNYSRSSLNDRVDIEVGIKLNKSIRTIAKELNRSPSTISRELKRIGDKDAYTATTAQYRYLQARKGAVDRRGQIPNLVSIHLRPLEVEDRVTPWHWEEDLIKGKSNASAIGTLVERTSGYVMLIKMEDATATSAVIGFSAALNRVPLKFAKTMTYDQGKEMVRHAEITQNTGVATYFCDPHSPWQRGSNENINALIRQYLPKGTDLSVHSQEEVDEIALSLNRRPRKWFGFRSPIEVITELLHKEYEASIMTKH